MLVPPRHFINIFSSQKKFCKKGVIVVIAVLHTCNIKVKGNLISQINECHLVHQKFFLPCFIFFNNTCCFSDLYDIKSMGIILQVHNVHKQKTVNMCSL